MSSSCFQYRNHILISNGITLSWVTARVGGYQTGESSSLPISSAREAESTPLATPLTSLVSSLAGVLFLYQLSSLTISLPRCSVVSRKALRSSLSCVLADNRSGRGGSTE